MNPSSIPTTAIAGTMLASLLTQDESPVLDFKSEIHRIDDENQNVRKQAIDELIRDILALANANTVFAGEIAHLVYGAADKKVNGKRELFDVGEHRLSASRILDWVNAACDPKIENLSCEEVIEDGKCLLLITIYPTPYIHETTRRLQPKADKVFSERTAFVRREQKIGVATQKERETILQIKRFRFDQKRNPPGVPFGVLLGGFVGSTLGYGITKNYDKLPKTTELPATSSVAGGLFGAIIGWSSAATYKDFYEIRAYWHKIPKHLRVPGVVASVAGSILITKALGYVLSRILPKPKS
jgi:hypothetical protein